MTALPFKAEQHPPPIRIMIYPPPVANPNIQIMMHPTTTPILTPILVRQY